MQILHLNSNFLYSKLYENQLNEMSSNFEHIIYNPLRNKKENKTKYKVLKPVFINKTDSILSFKRLDKSFKYLKKNILLEDLNLINANTLTNDGILALKIYKKYKTPYILTVRNTDINYSLKYKKHLKNLYLKTILHSKKVIFPNHSYRKKLLSIYKDNEKLKSKLNNSLIIPNGIDQLWIDNPNIQSKTIVENKVKVLFIARIYKDKNLHNLLKAINNMDNIELTVVGKIINKDYYNKLKENYKFKYLGTKSKHELINLMNDFHVFAMPSFKETFGLVYVEALSQNLPILYTRNEGIDKYFDDNKYGKSVNPEDVNSIINGLEYIIKNYESIQNNLKDKNFLQEFNWIRIGKLYDKLYLGVKNE